MRTALALTALACLAACTAAARSESYFEAHPDEAAQVLSACTSGTHRGAECHTARAADARLKADARMRSYGKAF
jgi:predicted naringenin-chalcone synthase